MGISVGYNTFKLRSYTPQELDLPVLSGETYTVERHQRYFHICYIPFFSLGQSWAIRQSDGKLYKMDPSFQRDLDARHKFSTPWYTFIGPIAAGVILLLVMITTIREKANDNEREEKYFTENLQSIQKRFNSPSPADFYYFNPVSYGSEQVLQTIKHTKDSIYLMSADTVPDDYYSDPVPRRFADTIPGTVYKVSRKDLDKAICKNFNASGAFKGSIIPGLWKDAYKLTGISRIPGALWNLYSGSIGERGIEAIYRNNGFDVTIDKIVPIKGPKSWDLQLPVKWLSGHNITLQSKETASDFRLEVHCSDSLRNKIVYEVWGIGGYMSTFNVTLRE